MTKSLGPVLVDQLLPVSISAYHILGAVVGALAWA